MAAERVVHSFRGDGFVGMRLVRVDVTDPSINARRPYQLRRAGHFHASVLLEELTLDDLAWLRDSLTRELVQMGRSVDGTKR